MHSIFQNWDEESLPSIHSESTANLLSHIKNWSTGSSPNPANTNALNNSSSNNSAAKEATPSPVKASQNKKPSYNKRQHMSPGYSAFSSR